MLPLPRSLDPLDDETLAGYLLRLSYRLGLSPSQLVQMTGLCRTRHADSRFPRTIPMRYLLALDDGQVREFARATRLTEEEVRQLTLTSLGSRYGPLDRKIMHRVGSSALIDKNPWLNLKDSRYCPECLIGDGSAIQNKLGGSWRRRWHLPPVFACLTHRRLLRRHCPVCLSEARPDQSHLFSTFVRWPAEARLHPTSCRAPMPTRDSERPVCAAPLAIPTRTAAELAISNSTWMAVALIQRTMSSLLEDDAPDIASIGEPVSPALYFLDMATLIPLILLSWPTAKPLCPNRAMAAAINAEVASRERATARLGRPAHRQGVTSPWIPPPRAELACAAVLSIAAHILGQPTVSAARTYLAPLIANGRMRDLRAAEGARLTWHRTDALRVALNQRPYRPRRPQPPRPSSRPFAAI